MCLAYFSVTTEGTLDVPKAVISAGRWPLRVMNLFMIVSALEG